MIGPRGVNYHRLLDVRVINSVKCAAQGAQYWRTYTFFSYENCDFLHFMGGLIAATDEVTQVIYMAKLGQTMTVCDNKTLCDQQITVIYSWLSIIVSIDTLKIFQIPTLNFFFFANKSRKKNKMWKRVCFCRPIFMMTYLLSGME